MTSTQSVVFLHGLGEGADVWDAQRAALPAHYAAVVLDVFGQGEAPETQTFTLERAATRVVQELDRLRIERAHICGLSLGAMIALQLALDSPQRVRSLTLAAGQVRPPRVLMAVQSAVMRALPSSVFDRQGTPKAVMLSTLRAVRRVDFTGRLDAVSVPTLVLCGSRDRPNLPASRHLARSIRNAHLRLIPGAGHQSHLETPEEFSRALANFLTGAAQAQD